MQCVCVFLMYIHLHLINKIKAFSHNALILCRLITSILHNLFIAHELIKRKLTYIIYLLISA